MSPNPQRALRHAYSDLVSAFESFCKTKAKAISDENLNFQELFKVRRFFKKHIHVDIFEGLTDNELLTLRRIFQKRHSYEHYSGFITEKYVRNVPEDAKLMGEKAELSLNEFHHGAKVLRNVIENLIKSIEYKW